MNMPSKQQTHVGLKIGSYTGNGQVSQSITGIGFKPVYVKIISNDSVDADAWVFERIDNMVADRSISHYQGYTLNRGDRLKSLDEDGFTVGGQANTNGKEYVYIAIG